MVSSVGKTSPFLFLLWIWNIRTIVRLMISLDDSREAVGMNQPKKFKAMTPIRKNFEDIQVVQVRQRLTKVGRRRECYTLLLQSTTNRHRSQYGNRTGSINLKKILKIVCFFKYFIFGFIFLGWFVEWFGKLSKSPELPSARGMLFTSLQIKIISYSASLFVKVLHTAKLIRLQSLCSLLVNLPFSLLEGLRQEGVSGFPDPVNNAKGQ